MAHSQPGLIERTVLAGADLSDEANLYKFVKLSAGAAVLCDGVTDRPWGILRTLGASGTPVTVVRLGRTQVNSNAPLSVDDVIGTSSDAQAAAYAYGTDTTKFMCGTVVEASGAAGGYATADINCINPPRGA